MSPFTIFNFSSFNQCLYSITDMVLSRYDKSGLSWSHHLDVSLPQKAIRAVCFVGLIAGSEIPENKGTRLSEYVLAYRSDDAELPCQYAHVELKERLPKIRSDVLSRAVLDSIEITPVSCTPLHCSGGHPYNDTYGYVSPMPSVSDILPIKSFAKLDCILFCAHDTYGSALLRMQNNSLALRGRQFVLGFRLCCLMLSIFRL